jgi:predicted TIM-barrel fold metal-dependent hydrolase
VEIVDAHHHLVGGAPLVYPWREEPDPVFERVVGDYAAIRREFLASDYKAEAGAHGVVSSVAVEYLCSDPVAEARWLQASADEHGFPNAIVARIDLLDAELPRLLDAYGELRNIRGVRQHLAWSEVPHIRFAERGDLMRDPDWLGGFALLAERGLLFDLAIFGPQLEDARVLASAHPDTTLVLETIGWPLDTSRDGLAFWREGMAHLSECPNASVKFSGLPVVFRPPTVEVIAPWVRSAVELFGPDRCMFGSDFPPDRLFWSYGELVRVMGEVLDELAPEAQRAIFHDTAQRIYGLGGDAD